MSALSVRQLSVVFGGLRAVSDVSLELEEGGIYGLIGPNGAGKTTLFNAISGVYRPTSGEIHANGRKLSGLSPYQVVSAGVARTFQNLRLFRNLSVLDHVRLALDHSLPHVPGGVLASLVRSPAYRASEREKLERAEELLGRFGLRERRQEQASGLPYGDQRRLEIARAVATGARLLLLDEPAAGMNHTETAGLMESVRALRQSFGLTILLIEHDMKLVMGLCQRITVLDHGVKIAEGDPAEIRTNPAVIEAYLGASHP